MMMTGRNYPGVRPAQTVAACGCPTPGQLQPHGGLGHVEQKLAGLPPNLGGDINPLSLPGGSLGCRRHTTGQIPHPSSQVAASLACGQCKFQVLGAEFRERKR